MGSNREKDLIKIIEERKLDIDYIKLKKTIEDAIKVPSIEVSKLKKFLKKLNNFLFKVLLPITTIVIALYGHMITFNNSSLTYEYIDQTVESIKTLEEPMKIVIDDKDANFTRVPIKIKLNITSGSIKSIYLAKTNVNDTIIYEKLSYENIKKELPFLLTPSVTIKHNIDNSSPKEIQDIPLWLIIVDGDNNIYIDFYEIITNSIAKVENNNISLDASYKVENIVYNFRVVKYESLFETDFLEKAEWDNKENTQYSTYDEEKILESINQIKERFNKIY